jgi:hypothetical protein
MNQQEEVIRVLKTCDKPLIALRIAEQISDHMRLTPTLQEMVKQGEIEMKIQGQPVYIHEDNPNYYLMEDIVCGRALNKAAKDLDRFLSRRGVYAEIDVDAGEVDIRLDGNDFLELVDLIRSLQR